MKRFLIPLFCSAFMAGCTDSKPPLSGERQVVFVETNGVNPKAVANDYTISLPYAIHNESWPMASGNARHAMQPVELSESVQKVWSRNVGQGTSGNRRITNGPIAAEGKVFTIDAEGQVYATNMQDGSVAWKTNTRPSGAKSQSFGGGLAYDNGKLYASIPSAEVVSLDAQTGEIKGRHPISAPSRAAPTVYNGKIYVTTINNQLDVIDSKTGQTLWTHSGMIESAGLLGAASPAIYGDVVVVPYSSGEVYALRAENGYPLWAESLSSISHHDPVSTLAHIKARPIIEKGRVFLISYGGTMSALNARNGNVLWSQEIGGTRSPAVGQDVLFMITNANQLIAISQRDGQVLWIKELPKFMNPEKAKDRILWAGPILSEHHLIISGSNGTALLVSPKNGDTIQELNLQTETMISPIIADKTLFFLTETADLIAYR